MWFSTEHMKRLFAALALLVILAVPMTAVFAEEDEENVTLTIAPPDEKDISASGTNGMVATAHPLASQAALEILELGGNAVDAAVAAAFAIGVVEPDGSGIGGGGGMTIFLNGSKEAHYINYYQQAGAKVSDISYDPESDRHTAKAVLVPGTVDGLITALNKYGSLPLATVMEPAIRYAEEGFEIDATLAQLILDNTYWLQEMDATASTFLEEGFPRMQGELLVQPELAETLKLIAERGRDGFYTGPVAEALVEGLKATGGCLTLDDFKDYHSEVTTPLEGSYRGYHILAARAPQSGSTIIEALNILENADLKDLGHYSTSPLTLNLMAQTFSRVYADRWQYLGDPHYSYVPERGFIAKGLGRDRYLNINQYRLEPDTYRQTQAGNPAKYDNDKSSAFGEEQPSEKKLERWSDDVDDEGQSSYDEWGENLFDSWGNTKKEKKSDDKKAKKDSSKKKEKKGDSIDDDKGVNEEFDGSTTHLSVIDKDGNCVALTQTLGTFFGSGISIKGVLLNCGMSNYSKTALPNLLRAGSRPRSSISPTIVLKNDKPFLVVGSPGASRIPCTVTETIVNIIDFGMNASEANLAPRFYCEKFNDYLHVEKGISEDVQKKLSEMGHNVRAYAARDLFFGGVQLILVDQATGTYYGSADPRRGGRALGY